MNEPRDYARGVRAGDRRLLSQAITLVESTRAEDAARAVELLEELAPDAGGSLRVGVSGVPGVGKSTLIDALGCRLTARGRSVAVLAVDPSSALSGGSVLGDKTRMTGLAREQNAFIRPSPAAASLGGVARRTREAMLLCEAARFDPVIVETIGVGQSEVAVSHMVDVFVVLVLAGAGDELQGIKRGILELADLIVVTKADGDNERRAAAAAAELGGALRILRGARAPAVMTCSAVSGDGLDELWGAIETVHAELRRSGALDERRVEQGLRWFESAVEELLRQRFLDDPRIRARSDELREQVRDGRLQPTAAARRLLDPS